jgi:hypothetical protein
MSLTCSQLEVLQSLLNIKDAAEHFESKLPGVSPDDISLIFKGCVVYYTLSDDGKCSNTH